MFETLIPVASIHVKYWVGPGLCRTFLLSCGVDDRRGGGGGGDIIYGHRRVGYCSFQNVLYFSSIGWGECTVWVAGGPGDWSPTTRSNTRGPSDNTFNKSAGGLLGFWHPNKSGEESTLISLDVVCWKNLAQSAKKIWVCKLPCARHKFTLIIWCAEANFCCGEPNLWRPECGAVKPNMYEPWQSFPTLASKPKLLFSLCALNLTIKRLITIQSLLENWRLKTQLNSLKCPLFFLPFFLFGPSLSFFLYFFIYLDFLC